MSVLNTIPWTISSSIPGKNFIRHMGEDLILIRRASVNAMMDQPFKTENYVVLLCTEGVIEGEVNMQHRTIECPGLIFMNPGQVIQFKKLSGDFQMHLAILSSAFMEKMDLNGAEFLPLSFLSKLKESPIVRLQREDAKDVVAIFNLLFRLVRNEDNPFREKSVQNVIRAFCLEAGYYIMKTNPDVLVPPQNSVVEKLLPLIKLHFRQHRDVGFYAEQFSLSPNYLYKVVLAASGKSVREWIEECVVTEAKAMLRSSSMNIREISDDLNFPSQAFFGKFFKRKTGLSPKQYRKSLVCTLA